MSDLDLQNIPNGFGTIPWWIWNGRMECGEMRRQLEMMKEAGLEGWMLWARFGLEMKYLGHEFMTKFRFAVQESARLGLEVWIFDEYAWPTGNAQNQVQEVNPEFRMRVLSAFTYEVEGGGAQVIAPDWGASGRTKEGPISTYLFPSSDAEGNRLYFNPKIERAIAVNLKDGTVLNISGGIEDLKVRWTAPAGSWRVLVLVSRDFGSLIDHLNPEVVRTYLEMTHEKYKRYMGEFFGTTIKGFFSDETRMFRDTQHRFSEPTITWTKDLFTRLEKAGIEDIDRTMAAVFLDIDAPRRLRFWQVLTDFYSEAFYGQIIGWAEKNGLIYTGDCFSEDSQSLAYLGDYFKCMSRYHMPGLDSLCLPRIEDREIFKSPKFPSSVAHMKGEATRCLAEGPGLLGWGTTMEEMRRVTDWLYVFGTNRLVPNALMYTIAHEQLYETPSYFFQWTLWAFYRDWDTYVKRLGFVLTRGRHVPTVAVFYPTEWQFSHFRPITPTVGIRMGEEESVKANVDIAYGLLRRQIDFDYVNSAFLKEQDLSKGKIQIGQAQVDVLVMAKSAIIPSDIEAKIKEFETGGGKVIRVESYKDQEELEENLEKAVSQVTPLPVMIASDQRHKFAIQMRQDGENEYLFIVYFGDQGCAARIDVQGWSGFERCNLQEGNWYPTGVKELEFAPFGSVLLRKSSPAKPVSRKEIELSDEWTVSVPDDNVFVPSEVRVSTKWIKRQAWEAILCYTTEFTLDLAAGLSRCILVLDEVDYFVERGWIRVLANGQSAPVEKSIVLDPGLISADLSPHLTAGKNTIRIEIDHSDYDSQTLLMHKRRSPAPQVRPRVFGHFLTKEGQLHPMQNSIQTRAGDLSDAGLEFYSGRAIYRQRFTLTQAVTIREIRITDLAHHAVVRIDGKEIGRILWRPFRSDCRCTLRAGDHEMEIEVINTQGNQMFEQRMPLGLLGKVIFLYE